jgi:hypothetical protein
MPQKSKSNFRKSLKKTMRSHKGGKSNVLDPKIAEMLQNMGNDTMHKGGNAHAAASEMHKKMGNDTMHKGGNPDAAASEMMKKMGNSAMHKGGNANEQVAEMMKKMGNSAMQKGGNPNEQVDDMLKNMINSTVRKGISDHSASKMHKKMSQSEMQKGGSPASSLVMSSYDSPVMNDYILDPRTGPRDNTASCQSGGSTASDMVTSQLNDVSQTVNYPEGYKVNGNINSLNLYAPSGGAKKNKKRGNKKGSGKSNKRNSKSKSNSKRNSKKRNSKKNNHMNKYNNIMKGGHASDWISSQYSLGDINGNSMNSNTNNFSSSQGVSRDILMNPPTLGLAGSGYPMSQLEGANVHSIGAPLV